MCVLCALMIHNQLYMFYIGAAGILWSKLFGTYGVRLFFFFLNFLFCAVGVVIALDLLILFIPYNMMKGWIFGCFCVLGDDL